MISTMFWHTNDCLYEDTRDGVRSYGCWEKHDSITSVEGSHADLPTYPPALQRVQPWVTCESVISELESYVLIITIVSHFYILILTYLHS